MNRQVIEKTTKKVRKILEQSQKDSRRWTKNLCGACAIGSDLLRLELQKFGIESHLVVGIPKSDEGKWSNTNIHCWLEGDGFLIDITHSQAKEDEPIVIIFKEDNNDEYDNDYENYLSEFSIQMNKAELDEYSYFLNTYWVRKENPFYTTKKLVTKYSQKELIAS